MEYIGKVKYIGCPPKWAKKIIKKDKTYPATDLSTEDLINIELDIEPRSFFTDIPEKFEIMEDPDGILEALIPPKESKD